MIYRKGRFLKIAFGVLALHLGALLLLEIGLQRPSVKILVPVTLLSDFVEPPAKSNKSKPLKSAPLQKDTSSTAPPQLALPPTITNPISDQNQYTEQKEQLSTAAQLSHKTPHEIANENRHSEQAQIRIETPSSEANYLKNAKPVYPALSRRLGEQGKVVIRVFIGIDGMPKNVEILESSGFERLDQTALRAVQRWQFVPGKRDGVPEAMWFNVPLNFQLE